MAYGVAPSTWSVWSSAREASSRSAESSMHRSTRIAGRDRLLATEATRNDEKIVDLRLSADWGGQGHLHACKIGRMRKLEQLGLAEPLGRGALESVCGVS